MTETRWQKAHRLFTHFDRHLIWLVGDPVSPFTALFCPIIMRGMDSCNGSKVALLDSNGCAHWFGRRTTFVGRIVQTRTNVMTVASTTTSPTCLATHCFTMLQLNWPVMHSLQTPLPTKIALCGRTNPVIASIWCNNRITTCTTPNPVIVYAFYLAPCSQCH